MPEPSSVVRLGVCAGVVASFDDPRGLGVLRSESGVEYPFHCANIADGTRRIAEGAAVVWTVIPGRSGRWEGSVIRPAREVTGS